MLQSSQVRTGVRSIRPAGDRRGRTRWRRFGVVAGGASTALLVLLGMVAQGRVAVALTSPTGVPFSVQVHHVHGTAMHFVPGTTSDGQNSVNIGMNTADLTDVRQVLCFGKIGVVITAAQGGTSASADNLVIKANGLSASKAKFTNLAMGGLPADQSLGSANNALGGRADSVEIDALGQPKALTMTGNMTLPGLSMGVDGSAC